MENEPNNVYDLNRVRKIKALEQNVAELAEVTTTLKSAMQNLSKYVHYSDIKKHVNGLFELYKDVRETRAKKLELLERLKNEK